MAIEGAIECLGTLLREIGWNSEQNEPGVFHFDLGPPHLPIATGLAAIIRESARLLIYLNFGFLVSAERRDDVLRLVTRTNWGLIIGNFELDLDDGHLRFKSSLDFEGTELDECLVRNLLLGAMEAVEAHGREMMKAAMVDPGVNDCANTKPIT